MNDKNAKLDAKRRRERVESLFSEDPNLNAGQIYRQIVKEFGENNVQGLNAVQKQLQPMRERYEKSKGLDAPWQLGGLTTHELNPDVVPLLVQEQRRRIEEVGAFWKDEDTREHINAKPQPNFVTIWQALWASRLYSTITTLLADNPKAIPGSVIYWSGEYTVAEKWATYSDQLPLNTMDLDAALLRQPDMSLNTWEKDSREGKHRGLLFPPSQFGGFLPTPPDVDFANPDKIRKSRQKKWAKEAKRESGK